MTASSGGWTPGYFKNSLEKRILSRLRKLVRQRRRAGHDSRRSVRFDVCDRRRGLARSQRVPYTDFVSPAMRTVSRPIRAFPSSRARSGSRSARPVFLYDDANGYYGAAETAATRPMARDRKPHRAARLPTARATPSGNGWDFSTTNSANQGLTICGGGSSLMTLAPLPVRHVRGAGSRAGHLGPYSNPSIQRVRRAPSAPCPAPASST